MLLILKICNELMTKDGTHTLKYKELAFKTLCSPNKITGIKLNINTTCHIFFV